MVCKLVLLASLLSASRALRQREAGDESATKTRAGTVASLYTYGCPKTSAPAMTNLARGDGCFPGFRVVNIKDEWISDDVDIVPSLLVTTQYVHSKTTTLLLDQNGNAKRRECGQSELSFQMPSAALHDGAKYIERASAYGDSGLKAASAVGMTTSYLGDLDAVRSAARKAGWRLVGTSGNGEDVSHLFQNPESLACQVTFEGSDSFNDWVTDAVVVRVKFCGLRQKVHLGFRNEVRRMTGSGAWQRNIKEKLGGCSSVWSVGHSLGGAQATLFAACANSGKNGDSDYAKMGWAAGTPTKYSEI